MAQSLKIQMWSHHLMIDMIKAGDFGGNKVMDIVTGTFSLNELYRITSTPIRSYRQQVGWTRKGA